VKITKCLFASSTTHASFSNKNYHIIGNNRLGLRKFHILSDYSK